MWLLSFNRSFTVCDRQPWPQINGTFRLHFQPFWDLFWSFTPSVWRICSSFHHNVNFKITRKLCLLLQFFFTLLAIRAARGDMTLTQRLKIKIQNKISAADSSSYSSSVDFPSLPLWLLPCWLKASELTCCIFILLKPDLRVCIQPILCLLCLEKRSLCLDSVWCLQNNVCTCNCHYDHLVSVFS